jgi:hypothetical protein
MPTTKRKNKAVTAVEAIITVYEIDAKFSAGLLRNKNKEPNNTEIIPPIVSSP